MAFQQLDQLLWNDRTTNVFVLVLCATEEANYSKSSKDTIRARLS